MGPERRHGGSRAAGPDFGDPEPAAAPQPARRDPEPPSGPVLQSTRDLPVFEDAPDPAPATPATHLPAEPPRPHRIAARLAGVFVIVAIIAILLAIFMPRERPEGSAQSGPSPAPTAAVATPSPGPPRHVALGAADRSQTAAPVSVPREDRGDRLFTSGEAQAVLRGAEGVEKSQRDAVLKLMIALVREPQYQDPENFAILTATLGTVGLAMIPGGPTKGHHEIIDAVCAARTGADAARRLEAMQYESPFSLAVQQGLLAVIGSATSFAGFMEGVDRVQRENGIELAPDTLSELQRQAEQAAARRGQDPTQPSH